MLLAVGTSAIAGLGAAGPALAEDVPPPIVPVPAPPSITVPALPPEIVEPPIVVTQIDGENVDVSIDVLGSAVVEGTAEPSAEAVVSPNTEGDTTAPAEAVAADAAETIPDGAAGAANTNVSVRVLSPGTNGDPGQSVETGEGGVAPAGAEPEAPRPDSAPAVTTTPEAARDSGQYQDANSQYQSTDQIAEEPWNWEWTLVLDCAGNPTSSSADSGDPESLEWSWEWSWEWGCSEAQRESQEPREGASAGERSTPSTEPRAPPAAQPETSGSATGSATSAEAEPWNWTWTFTFCGKTTTISTQAGIGTPLTWTWDWTWIWSCGTAPAAGVGEPTSSVSQQSPPVAMTLPTSGTMTTAPPAAAASAESVQIPAVSVPAVTFTVDTGAATATLELPSVSTEPLELSVEVAIPPVVSPSLSATPSVVPLLVLPFPPGAAPRELGPSSTTSPPAARPPLTRAPPTRHVFRTPAPTAVGHAAGDARPERQSRPHVARARPASTPLAPSVPRPRHGASSSSASGAASSALLVGIAALTGFVLLAAPSFGRRLEVARELSPRSLDQSPLDHPG